MIQVKIISVSQMPFKLAMFIGVKKVVGIVNKVGSINMIFILLFVILIFFMFCVFDILRIIQLNEDVAMVILSSLLTGLTNLRSVFWPQSPFSSSSLQLLSFIFLNVSIN